MATLGAINSLTEIYSKSEVDTISSGKADKVGTSDIEITDDTKGLILKDTITGLRIRLSFVNGILTGTTV